MRLNSGTLILLVVALVVIVGVIILTNQQAGAPGDPTPTPVTQSGSVFESMDTTAADSLQIVNYEAGDFVNLAKDAGGAWSIDGTYQSDVTPPDQAAVVTNLTTLSALQYTDRFQSSELAPFGLDQPVYSFVITTANGGQYTLYVGGKNPAGNRYYAVAQSIAGEGTLEPSSDTSQAISTPDTGAVDVTAEPTAEVTSESAVAAVLEAAATSEATAESTVESTGEATADILIDITPAPTLVRFTGERPALSGEQTILLINSSALDPLLNLINLPPYAPTPTPTATATATPNPYSEVEQTATAASIFATQSAFSTQLAATATAMVATTAEVTAEATASP